MQQISPEFEKQPDVTFRQMTRDDFPLLQKWLLSPAVAEWWTEPKDLSAIEKKYGPNVDKISATKSFVTLAGSVPIGMMQAYWIKDYPEYGSAVNLDEAVAFDWFIGDEQYLGKGLGKDIARNFAADIILEYFPTVQCIVASPSHTNARSIHVLEKAGFENRGLINVSGEPGPETLMVLPVDQIKAN